MSNSHQNRFNFNQIQEKKVSAKFLDELPKYLKKKEEAMIEQIRKKLSTGDEQFDEQFDMIVNNSKNTFN